MSNKRNNIKNKILVNTITGLRTMGTAAMIPIYLNFGFLGAGISAMILFITDFIDGYLARKLNAQTFFGSLLDGLSDKAFGIICLLLLSISNPLFLSVIATEILILYINYKSIERGNNAKSSIAGKIKTCLMGLSVVGSFFAYAMPNLKEVLHYANATSLDKLLSVNPDIISTCLVTGLVCADAYVIADYNKKAKKQDAIRKENIEKEQIIKNIEKIEDEKQKLCEEKKKISQIKSKQEILHALFDTDFYLAHKDDGIKKLLFK